MSHFVFIFLISDFMQEKERNKRQMSWNVVIERNIYMYSSWEDKKTKFAINTVIVSWVMHTTHERAVACAIYVTRTTSLFICMYNTQRTSSVHDLDMPLYVCVASIYFFFFSSLFIAYEWYRRFGSCASEHMCVCVSVYLSVCLSVYVHVVSRALPSRQLIIHQSKSHLIRLFGRISSINFPIWLKK